MKVKELIAKLQTMNYEKEVLIGTSVIEGIGTPVQSVIEIKDVVVIDSLKK